jgi:membrane-associated phospholipid phosphatase
VQQENKESSSPDKNPDNAPSANQDGKAEHNHQAGLPDAGAVAGQIQHEVQTARRPWYRVLRQARFLLGVYLIMLALFASLAFWVHVHPVLQTDVAITREFQENQSPWLRTFMIAVSYLGNTSWLFVGLIALAVGAFWFFRLRLEAVLIACVSLTSSLLNLAVKLLIERPRPTSSLVTILQHASGKSFPSGHVMSYMAFWGLLFSLSIMVFKGRSWWRIALLIISGLFVVLVGPSRIYLGDHWASDVLGAYLLEGLWLWLWLWLYVQLKARGVLASSKRSDRASEHG